MRHPKDIGDRSLLDLGTVYIVPIEDVNVQREARLRGTPPRNNQCKGVRLAAPYEIARLEID